jgi:hypothetical protein
MQVRVSLSDYGTPKICIFDERVVQLFSIFPRSITLKIFIDFG